MDDQLYADLILEHWQNPQNYGEIKNPDRKASQANLLCGDKIDLCLKCQLRNGKCRKVLDAKFTGNGCAISQASASILTTEIKGKDVEKINKMTDEKMVDLLGIKPGPARLKCATLALKALKKALQFN